VREGKFPGAVPYGYNAVPGQPGVREINPETAEIVRRIFREYAEHKSPRQIANDLNAEGIPSPSGGLWTHQGFVGGRGHKKGLITNPIYLGTITWCRLRTVRNPENGKQTKRLAPESEVVTVDAPHLRIVDQALWDAAQRVRTARSVHRFGPSGKSRSSFVPRNQGLLAGLLRCGCCSGHMVIGQKSRNGNGRVVCAAASMRSACEHTKSYDLGRLQAAVLDSMRTRLADQRALELYVETFKAEYAEIQRKAQRDQGDVRRKLADVEAGIMRFVNALERGSMPEDIIIPRLEALEAERVVLRERQKLAHEHATAIELHPLALERYRRDLQRLHDQLAEGSLSAEERSAFRNVVDHIVVKPTRKRMPYEIDTFYRLGAFNALGVFPPMRSAGEIAAAEGVALRAVNYDNGGLEKSVSS
jgi:site-specific DNA recombinase